MARHQGPPRPSNGPTGAADGRLGEADPGTPPDLDRALSRPAVAAYLGVSIATVDREVARGRLAATRVGRRVIVLPQELSRYLGVELAPPPPPDSRPPAASRASTGRTRRRKLQPKNDFRSWAEHEWPRLFPRSRKTIETNLDRCRLYLWPRMPRDGHVAFDDLRRPLLREIQRELVRARYARSTVNGAFAALSAICSDAVEMELLAYNPALGLTVQPNDPDLRPRARRQRRNVPLEELIAFYGRLDDRHLATVLTPLVTGCRPEEVLGLRVADIDRSEQLIRVHQTVSQTGVLEPGTKGRRTPTDSGRWTLFPASLATLLTQRPEDSTGLLFPSPRGKPWNRRNFYNRVFYSGFDDGPHAFDLYDLRHTFASRLAHVDGVSDADIGSWMGHSSWSGAADGDRRSITRRVYIHATGQSLAPALDAMNDLVDSILEARRRTA